MVNQDRESRTDALKREMLAHLCDLRDRCDSLIAAKYPLNIYNEIPALRSLLGQIDSAAKRWRDIS